MTIDARHLETLIAIDRLGATPPPSYRELAVELLADPKTARKLVAELAVAGAVEVAAGQRRSVRLTAEGRRLLEQAQPAAPELPEGQFRAWRNRFVWKHARDAVRTWWGWRKGQALDRARSGKAPGRPASLEDVSRVGAVLQAYAPDQVAALVAWAKGSASTTDNRLEHLVDRLTRRLQGLHLVSRATVRTRAHRSIWRDSEGQERATVAFLPDHVDSACKVPGIDP